MKYFAFVLLACTSLHAETGNIQPMIVENLIKQAQKNENWKIALATGKYEQIVFMNISPATNPQNEIGMEVHPFDQAIFIVEGKGKAVLDGKITPVKEGDLIFIPTGTSHNVINLGGQKELKIISFYSSTDIPAAAVYPTKESEGNE